MFEKLPKDKIIITVSLKGAPYVIKRYPAYT